MVFFAPLAHFLFFVVCGIWGTSFLCMKKAGAVFTDVEIAAVRVTLAAATLAIFWALRRTPWPFRWADTVPLLLFTLIGYVVPYMAQPYVIRRTSSGFVATLVILVPLMTVIVSVPMLGVRPSKRQLVGVLGGLLFAIVLCADKLHGIDNSFALIVGLIVPLVYAVTNTYIRRRWHHTSPLVLSFVATSLAAALLVPVALTNRVPKPEGELAVAIGALILLGVFGTGVAIAIFYWLIRDRGPLYASMVTYVAPWVALVLGWFDAERISARHLVALAGILMMVWLVQYDPVRQGQGRV